MLYFGVVILILVLFLGSEQIFLKNLNSSLETKQSKMLARYNRLQKREESINKKIEILSKKTDELSFFYELIREIAFILDKEELFKVFFEEIQHLGKVQRIKLVDDFEIRNCLKFELGKEKEDILFMKTQSRTVIEYMPYFAKILGLCVERIDLYEKLQQLSIYDSLTETYNRRYFMQRYNEEFLRTEKFKLNLSFLMIDIDYFKRINDTYGHLVGDVILREVARIIQENIRQVDFVCRWGGEEFAAILTDTDKSGALMVGQRICSAVNCSKIRAFDELIGVTISVGVASYPANTFHSDVLLEVADEALYKAKLAGRNRVCWF